MSNDKPEYRAAQTAHAQEVRTVRTISRMTGFTPNQVRVALRAAGRDAGRTEVQQKLLPAPPAPQDGFGRSLPGPTQNQEIRPNPIAPPPVVTQPKAVGDQSTDNLVLLEDMAYLLFSDSTIHITNLYTDGRDVVLP